MVPGLGGCIVRPLGSQVGRLVVHEFTDPGRLAGLDPAQVRAEAANHGVGLHIAVAHCLVATARVALTSQPGAAARVVLAEDLRLLEALDEQVAMAEQRLGVLVARTPFAVLTTTPGWSTVRAAAYAAAVGDLARSPVAPAGLPSVRAAPGRLRLSRAASRWWDQPGRLGGVGAGRCLGSALACGATIPRARAWAAQLRALGQGQGRGRDGVGQPGRPDHVRDGA